MFDLDGTLTAGVKGVPYASQSPNIEVVNRLIEYQKLGYQIVIMTARNMRTHNGSIGLINAKTLPEIINWLNLHQIPYDEIHVGKPWCGEDGFYVDDRAVRPEEFANLTYEEIQELLGGHITNRDESN